MMDQNNDTTTTTNDELLLVLKQIALLIPQFKSPFDLFDTAKQAIIFGEQQDDNDDDDNNDDDDELLLQQQQQLLANICLLLCCWAMEQIQMTKNQQHQQRWKRPQSILMETILLYQRYLFTNHNVVLDTTTTMWTNYVVPACLSLQVKLPLEAAHDDIVTGLIGTTSRLVEESPQHIQDLFRCIEPMFKNNHHRCNYSVLIRNSSPHDDDDDEHDVHFGMDMTRSDFGVAKLAFLAWKQDRSTVPTMDGIIHTTSLLLNGDWEDGIEWLDAIDEPHPNPIPILQLLGNRMVSLAMMSSSHRQNDNDNAPEMFRRMSVLLQRYPSEQQVNIVEQLLTMSSSCHPHHPSLQAKWIDLLRPLAIHHPSPPPPQALWKLLDGLLHDMDDQSSSSLSSDSDLSLLLTRTEVYVAVLTMLQFYLLVHHHAPPSFTTTDLGAIVKRVSTRIREVVVAGEGGRPRDQEEEEEQGGLFRLNLLEMALEHVQMLLVDGE